MSYALGAIASNSSTTFIPAMPLPMTMSLRGPVTARSAALFTQMRPSATRAG
jgi:hypothetical protein